MSLRSDSGFNTSIHAPMLIIQFANSVVPRISIVMIVVLFGAVGRLFVPRGMADVGAARVAKPPSADHWLGTDQQGRDVLADVIYGTPGSLETYTEIVGLNLIGSFNVLRLAAAEMAKNEPLEGDRGVVILTASVAAFEGQIGQIPYASSKAGIVGMTIVAARDLASKAIRVCTIAPGIFDTPLLARVSDEVRASLTASVPHPSRLGLPDEFARLALSIIDNGMLNGETIRLDGAIRMAPR